MKKILCILVTLLLLLMPVAAFAADWSNPNVTSPYNVAIIPVKSTTNMFGQTSYTQDFGTAAAGDSIAFVVRIEVPDKPQAATLTLKGTNAVLNAVLSAALPPVQGVYYMAADGSMRSTADAVITGYCTGVPTVTAYIKGGNTLNSIGAYTVVKSDGYFFMDDGRGMVFYTEASGKVYSAYIIGADFITKLNVYNIAEDSEAGVIARAVLKTLGIDGSALLAGSVYMTDKLLASNFGVLIDTEASKTWGVSPVAQTVTPITEVPATGIESDAISIVSVLVMVGIAWLIYKMVKEDKRR